MAAKTTDVIPYVGSPLVLSDEQTKLKSAIIEAFQEARITGFGGDGSVFNVVTTVRSHRLWISPHLPVEYSAEELAAAKKSLVANDQRSPIHVLKIPDPTSRRPDGTTETDLMINDIDGALLFTAAATSADRDWLVIVDAFEGGYYKHIGNALSRKAQQHQMRPVEIGRAYLRMRDLYEAEEAYLHARGGGLPKFPQQRDLAASLGMSESNFSRCIDLALQPEKIINMVQGEAITMDQMRDLMSIPDVENRIAMAEQLADQNRQSHVVREDTRAAIRLVAPPKVKKSFDWRSVTAKIPLDDLLRPDPNLQEMDSALALALQLHNISIILEYIEVEKPGKVLSMLRKIVAEEEVQVLFDALDRQIGISRH